MLIVKSLNRIKRGKLLVTGHFITALTNAQFIKSGTFYTTFLCSHDTRFVASTFLGGT